MILSEFIEKLQKLEEKGHGDKRVAVEEFVTFEGCTCGYCEERADMEVYSVDVREEYNSSRIWGERSPEIIIRICREL